jgi:CheY-like chemotaxis protein
MSLYALIAEDNLSYQIIIRTALEFAGYDVEIAPNGAEALRRLSEKQFHLLCLDLNMPVMDGITCLRLVRSMPDCDQMYVLVLTANSHMMGATEIEEMADFTMMKPVNVEELSKFAERLKPSARQAVTIFRDS